MCDGGGELCSRPDSSGFTAHLLNPPSSPFSLFFKVMALVVECKRFFPRGMYENRKLLTCLPLVGSHRQQKKKGGKKREGLVHAGSRGEKPTHCVSALTTLLQDWEEV